MNKKKILFNKFTSLFLALLMLLQIPLNSICLYATNEIESSEENSSIVENASSELLESTTSELNLDIDSTSSTESISSSTSEIIPENTGSSSTEISSEDTSNLTSETNTENNTSSSEYPISSISEEGSEETNSGFELKLYGFASNVDSGNTATNNIHFDITSTGFSEQFKIQVNYTNKSVDKTYAPGELQIKVNDPTKYLFYEYNPYCYSNFLISADKKESTEKQYQFSYEYVPPTYNPETKCFEGGYLLFINNNTIEKEQAVAGSFQITFPITAKEIISTSGYNITATIGNIESNPINVSFSIPQRTYTLKLNDNNISKITGYTGLGENAEDYIWVKTKITVSNDYKPRNINESKALIKIPVENENIIVISSSSSYPAVKEGNAYYLNAYYNSNIWTSSNQSNIFIGYPKNIYQGQTISQSFELCGIHNDMYIYSNPPIYNILNYDYTNQPTISEYTTSFNLTDFEYNSSEKYYNIDLYNNSSSVISYDRLTTPNANSHMHPVARLYSSYNNEPYNLRFGIDLVTITDDNGTRILSEENYNFSNSFSLNTLRNENGIEITKDKYTVKLYIKEKGKDYQLADTFVYTGSKWFNGSTYGWSNIVGYYFEIENLEESIYCDTSDYYSYTISSSTVYIYNMQNISPTGTITVSSFIDVYKYDENQNEIQINILDEYTYPEDILKHDLNQYGHYIQRDNVSSSYDNEYIRISSMIQTNIKDNSKCKETINNIDKYVTKTEVARIGTYYYNHKFAWFTGYDFYILLPENAILNSSAQTIKNNLLNTCSTNSYLRKYYSEIDKATTINITKNWKNTGRTMINVLIDCCNNPLMFGDDINSSSWTSYCFDVQFDMKISFNAISENNNFQTETWGYYLQTSEYPITVSASYNDVNDTNNNGDTSEKVDKSSATYIVTTAFESYQDVQTQIDTDRSSFTSGTVTASKESEYTYKLITRTGLNSVTNLKLYDNLETAYKENDYWQGEFIGIDTSYAENKGFTVKAYYSENASAGSLYNENNSLNTDWLEYNETSVDKTKVNSLAFEFLDSNGNPAIIPLNTYLYVLIKMKTPNEDLETYAYNNCRTEWVVLDDLGIPVEGIIGTESNTTQIRTNIYFDITVDKIWNDNNNNRGLRPDTIDIILYKDTSEVARQQVTANNLSVTFEDLLLDDFDSYYVGEAFQQYYTHEVTYNDTTGHYEITNTFNEKSLLTISGTKTWLNDTAEQRPESITIKLLQNGNEIATTTSTAAQNWKYSFSGTYPKYNTDGSEYNYTIKENPVENYITTYKPLYNGVSVTFSPNCNLGKNYLYIYYTYEGKTYSTYSYSGTSIAGQTINIPSTDFYIYMSTASYPNDCNYYGFSIDSIINKEITTKPSGYTSSIPNYYVNELKDTSYPESNHYPYEENVYKLWHYTLTTYDVFNERNFIDASGTKTWIGDTEDLRPDSITIKLLQDGNEIATTTSSASDNWEYSFGEYIKYRDDGTPYEYTLQEDPVDGYVAFYDYKDGYNITNEWNFITINGTKHWKDETDKLRPDSITIKLLRDGNEIATTTSSASDSWEYSFGEYIKYKDDKTAYIYTLEEVPVDNYIASYITPDQTGLAITFDGRCSTESGPDYVEIYYILDGITYKLNNTYLYGTSIANKTIYIPTNDFYLHWHTDVSTNNYYGFSIASIVPISTEIPSNISKTTLPDFEVIELSGSNYPESLHSPYLDNTDTLWHYTANSVDSYDIINTQSSYSIDIKKQDYFTKEAIENVSFNLYRFKDASTSHTHSLPGNNSCWELVSEVITDENGLLSFIDLPIDGINKTTIYALVENCPDGYILPNNIYWEISIGIDGKLNYRTVCDTSILKTFTNNYGWTDYSLDIQIDNEIKLLENMPEYREVTVTKQIKVSDINFGNGIPTFLFKLSTTDGTNTERTYYKNMVFTKEYVDKYTDVNGNVSMTVTFSDLVKGTYSLTEEDVGRYAVSEIIDIENGTNSGTTVTLDLINNISATATFVNDKYEHGYYSHNDYSKGNVREKLVYINGFIYNSEKTPILETIDIYSKINNGIMTYDNLVDVPIKLTLTDGTIIEQTMADYHLIEAYDGVYYCMLSEDSQTPLFISVTKETIINGESIPEGIYIIANVLESLDITELLVGSPNLTKLVIDNTTPVIEEIDGIFKVSEEYFMYEDLITYNMTAVNALEGIITVSIPLSTPDAVVEIADGIYAVAEMFINVTQTTEFEGIILTPGIYLITSPEEIPTGMSLIVSKEEYTPIKNVPLDYTVSADTTIIEQIDSLYKISNDILTPEQFASSYLYAQIEEIGGINFYVPLGTIGIDKITNYIYAFSKIFIIITQTTEYDGITYTPGIYTAVDSATIGTACFGLYVPNSNSYSFELTITPDTPIIEQVGDMYKVSNDYLSTEDFLKSEFIGISQNKIQTMPVYLLEPSEFAEGAYIAGNMVMNVSQSITVDGNEYTKGIYIATPPYEFAKEYIYTLHTPIN